MPPRNHVENPLEFIFERASWAASDVRRTLDAPPLRHTAAVPQIRRIEVADLWAALREGLRDLGVARSDVVFIALFYPLAGLVLGRLMFSMNMLPLVAPLVSGFALLGPVAAVGLYEISRRLEVGQPVSWSTPFEVRRSPAFTSILAFGAILALVFFTWVAAAWGIYAITIGPEAPTSLGSFMNDVFGTAAGWAMIVLGTAVGAVFAAFAFAISVISVPLMLDRDVGVTNAIRASIATVRANPRPMLVWGLVIAGAMVLGSIPALIGLMFVLPLFGHATWRLYRKLVPGD
ncbi:DUF2189 domain-containing protein [Phenylobacterium sp. LjRoot219]|uniref:DUF2189 domain-containing protein n=1 Tax=Phenylobacterium sp. LjRoot219 TaxID=3342283 RepID=UPI003ECEF58E